MDARALLASQLDHHVPATPVERDHLDHVRTALDDLTDPFDQHAQRTHVTGSAIVLADDDTPRTVLVHHKRLHRWLQPGGHVEPGEAVHEAARREAIEETGLDVAHPSSGPRLVHVHVHDGGRDHVHLDVRWLLVADPDQEFAPAAGESPRLGWFALDELASVADGSVIDAVTAARSTRFGPPAT